MGDSTATAELALWEGFIDSVQVNQSYNVIMINAHYSHIKRSALRVADLQDVFPTNSIKCNKETQQAYIIAVSVFNTFHRCILCRQGHILPVDGSDLANGRCKLPSSTKAGMLPQANLNSTESTYETIGS